MIILPPRRQWTQINNSDVLGSLGASFGLDLTKVVANTRFTRTLTTQSGLDGLPVAIKSDSSKLYLVAGSKVYVSNSLKPNTGFTADATSGTPTDCDFGSDIEYFAGNIYVAANSKLYKLAGTWTSVALGSASPYSMTTYANTLYIGCFSGAIKTTTDGSSISTVTTVVPSGYGITFMRAAANRIWIGTINVINNKGYIFEWDGSSTQATRAYRLEAQGALSCVIKDDIPWIVDTNGRLMVFNSGTFVEVARLPLEDKLLLRATLSSAVISTGPRFIHTNGMSLINSRINILIANPLNDATNSAPEFCPSGVWEYTREYGLYHKYAFSYTPVGSNTITDFGQNKIAQAGVLTEMKIVDTSATATGNFIAGAKVYTDASATSSCTFTNDTFDAVSGTTGQYATQGYSYFLTSRESTSFRNRSSVRNVGALQVNESFNKVFIKFKKLQSASDKIIVKYRATNPASTEITITWTSTSKFTTSTNLIGYEGYEVEILQGTGSGKCAHISRVDFNGTLYTITLDDTFTGATGTAIARVQNWIKSGEFSNTTDEIAEFPLGTTSQWIQIKFCFQTTGKAEFYELAIISTPNQLTV